MVSVQTDYAVRIAQLFQELGISASYATQRKLDLQLEATELTSVGLDAAGRDCRLIPEAAQAWRAMQSRAQSSEVALIPLSGFRSVDRQVGLIRGKLMLGQPIEEILRSLAAPGYSEHHTGRAIDLGSPEVAPLVEAFAQTKSFAWLVDHAEGFGFRLSFPQNNPHGIVYEPWHWCWHG